MGPIQDPRHPGEHPELRGKSLVPDVLLQSHSASLEMVFYTGRQFPAGYRNDAFAAEHGSWNRSRRTGYKVIRVPLDNGVPSGEYEDFLTGWRVSYKP
jgi:glucose/arabinose dehydrogenase